MKLPKLGSGKSSIERYAQKIMKKSKSIKMQRAYNRIDDSVGKLSGDEESKMMDIDLFKDNNTLDGSMNFYHPFDFPPLSRRLINGDSNGETTKELFEDTVSLTSNDSFDTFLSSSPISGTLGMFNEDLKDVGSGDAIRSSFESLFNIDELQDEIHFDEHEPRFFPKYFSTPKSNNFFNEDSWNVDEMFNSQQIIEHGDSILTFNSSFNMRDSSEKILIDNFDLTPTKFFNKQDSQRQSTNKKKRKRSKDEPSKENFQKKSKVRHSHSNVEKKPVSYTKHCEYCKEIGEPSVIYKHHTLKDRKGRTLCPTLRQIECKICGADGDNAHSSKKCPENHQMFGSEMKISFKKTLQIVRKTLKNFKI